MDLTITLGDLVSAAGPILAIVAAYMRISDRLTVVETRLGLVWDDYERRRRSVRGEG